MSEGSKSKSGKPFKANGFMMMSVLIIPIQLLALISFLTALSPSVGDFFNFLQHKILFGTHRGDFTSLAGLLIGGSVILTYLICCVGIKYDEIQMRLATHGRWLANWSFSRIVVVMVFNFVLFVMCLMFI